MPRQSDRLNEALPSCSCASQYLATIDGLRRQLEIAHRTILQLNLQLVTFGPNELSNSQFESLDNSLQQLLSILTKREQEVALAFMKNGRDAPVAKQLGVAAQTIRNQIASIQNKLNVDSREELILLLLSTERADNHRAKKA